MKDELPLNGEYNWGMCQRDNPFKEPKTAQGHQWVFNTARKSLTRRRC